MPRGVQILTRPSICTDYNRIPRRRPSNIWNSQQRKTICVLRRFFHNDWHDIQTIFNTAFCHDLATRGFDHEGLHYTAMQTQVWQMMVERAEEFECVYTRTDFAQQNALQNLRRRINSAAVEAEVVLKPREAEDALMLQTFAEARRHTKTGKSAARRHTKTGKIAERSHRKPITLRQSQFIETVLTAEVTADAQGRESKHMSARHESQTARNSKVPIPNICSRRPGNGKVSNTVFTYLQINQKFQMNFLTYSFELTVNLAMGRIIRRSFVLESLIK